MACRDSSGRLCFTGATCRDENTGVLCGMSNQGSNNNNQSNQWSNPYYWGAWNETLGSLGNSAGNWYNAFGGNNNQSYQNTNYPNYRPTNNTTMYIGIGVALLVLILIVYFFAKKS